MHTTSSSSCDGAFCFFGEVRDASAFRLVVRLSSLCRCAREMGSSESLELSGMPDYSETDLPRGNEGVVTLGRLD